VIDEPKIGFRHWWRMNRRCLPYVLIAPVLMVITDIILIYQGNTPAKIFRETYLNIFELAFIPLMGINVVYLANRIIDRTALAFWQQILLKIAFCLAGVLLATWIMEILAAWNGTPDDDDTIVIGSIQFSPAATNYITNGLLGMVIAIPLFFIQERRKRLEHNLESKNLELQRLEKFQVQSRLEALQSKLNPHFLYNSLNALAGLVYTDPARAEKVILGLSDLFRYSLQKEDSPLASLKEEVEIVKTYLDIEMVRFEGMLTYEIDIDNELLSWKVPRFLLQPLVENAIKHGTSRITKGHIQIDIHKGDGGQLRINIADNGTPFPEHIELGFGLGSTIEKLNLLYPDRHELHWANEPVKSIQILLKEIHEPV
jgi:LytS/YehU family sensor histidine kinase